MKPTALHLNNKEWRWTQTFFRLNNTGFWKNLCGIYFKPRERNKNLKNVQIPNIPVIFSVQIVLDTGFSI